MNITCTDPGAWREEISRQVLKLDFVFRKDEPFQASLHPILAFDTVRIFRLSQPAGVIRRDSRLAKGGPNTVALLFAEHGATEVRHNKKTVILDRGEATLLRNWEGGEIESHLPSDFLVVFLSPDLLNLAGAELDSVVCERWPLSGRLQAVLDYIKWAAPLRAVDASMKKAIERHLHELIRFAAPAASVVIASASKKGLADLRRRAILDEITANFSEPDFSELALSQKHEMSVRYIQKLLKTTGASFTQHMTRLRLEAVHAALVDPHNDQRTVAELAFGAGFKDLSHFNRLFRSYFGETPTLARRRRNAS